MLEVNIGRNNMLEKCVMMIVLRADVACMSRLKTTGINLAQVVSSEKTPLLRSITT